MASIHQDVLDRCVRGDHNAQMQIYHLYYRAMFNTAYRIVLDSVQVGDIKLRNVEGAIVMGDGPGKVLLGMSFLNRLQFENQSNVMVLRQKF